MSLQVDDGDLAAELDYLGVPLGVGAYTHWEWDGFFLRLHMGPWQPPVHFGPLF